MCVWDEIGLEHFRGVKERERNVCLSSREKGAASTLGGAGISLVSS